jgi:hypothetical protein
MGGFCPKVRQFGRHQNHDPEEEEEDTLSRSCPFSQNPKR